MKSIAIALCASLLLLQGCSHPIEIIGDGDVLSASGNRDCLLEDHAAQLDNCSTNIVAHDYLETYYAQPRSGWSFHRWANYCTGASSGTPQALWESATKRAAIQALLDGGEVELFGMTYHPDYPGIEGYRNWVNYALEKNPDTRFFIALPWPTIPANYDALTYENLWHASHPAIAHSLIDTLRAENPGIDFYCIPYGQSAAELRKLYSAGNLPDVDTLISSNGEAIYRDSQGHADDILLALGELVWLRAIYGVDLSSYDYDPGYSTDLKTIAQRIMDAHDVNYNAP